MTRDKLDIIPQRPEAFLDGTDQGVIITPWKISAANGSPEQYVTDDGKPDSGLKKYDMTRGMAGAVMHIQ